MRYGYEFKRRAVELYRQGKWIDPPPNCDTSNIKNFHDQILRWYKLEEKNGPEVLNNKRPNKKWTPEEKLELVMQAIHEPPINLVAEKAGIPHGMLHQWVNKYKTYGYNGLVDKRKGRQPKESSMKTNINNPRKLKESEYEELIRLRAENAYIKAENAVIKKEIALREEKQAALLKARKQQSLRNSEKKDIN